MITKGMFYDEADRLHCEAGRLTTEFIYAHDTLQDKLKLCGVAVRVNLVLAMALIEGSTPSREFSGQVRSMLMDICKSAVDSIMAKRNEVLS